jgi:hypothetical protein
LGRLCAARRGQGNSAGALCRRLPACRAPPAGRGAPDRIGINILDRGPYSGTSWRRYSVRDFDVTVFGDQETTAGPSGQFGVDGTVVAIMPRTRDRGTTVLQVVDSDGSKLRAATTRPGPELDVNCGLLVDRRSPQGAGPSYDPADAKRKKADEKVDDQADEGED